MASSAVRSSSSKKKKKGGASVTSGSSSAALGGAGAGAGAPTDATMPSAVADPLLGSALYHHHQHHHHHHAGDEQHHHHELEHDAGSSSLAGAFSDDELEQPTSPILGRYEGAATATTTTTTAASTASSTSTASRDRQRAYQPVHTGAMEHDGFASGSASYLHAFANVAHQQPSSSASTAAAAAASTTASVSTEQYLTVGTSCSTPAASSRPYTTVATMSTPASVSNSASTSTTTTALPLMASLKTSGMVRLNVGGHVFCTTIATLTREPSSMLAAMFSGRFPPVMDPFDCFFIDRDGTHFRHILNYLRDGVCCPPDDDIQMREEILAEARFYQLPGLVAELQGAPRATKREYLTIRYLPATTYDGWPIRIEGPLESFIIKELNGGSLPPERETPAVKNMYGAAATGWKLRGIFLTKIFNIIAKYGWGLCTSNGSGGGKTRNFAEMYVFSRYKIYRFVGDPDRRSSTSYHNPHHPHNFFAAIEDDDLPDEMEMTAPATGTAGGIGDNAVEHGGMGATAAGAPATGGAGGGAAVSRPIGIPAAAAATATATTTLHSPPTLSPPLQAGLATSPPNDTYVSVANS